VAKARPALFFVSYTAHNTPIWDLVVADMKERNKKGIETYGTPLQAFNNRDSLWDAYEEVLDLAVYLRQTIEEQNTSHPRGDN
jgi:hypothetical protein